MTLRRHLRAWVNHGALNLGVALRCVYHAARPPQLDHAPETVELLAGSSCMREFLSGIGAYEEVAPTAPEDEATDLTHQVLVVAEQGLSTPDADIYTVFLQFAITGASNFAPCDLPRDIRTLQAAALALGVYRTRASVMAALADAGGGAGCQTREIVDDTPALP